MTTKRCGYSDNAKKITIFLVLKKHFVYSQRVNIKNTIDRQVLNYEIHLL